MVTNLKPRGKPRGDNRLGLGGISILGSKSIKAAETRKPCIVPSLTPLLQGIGTGHGRSASKRRVLASKRGRVCMHDPSDEAGAEFPRPAEERECVSAPRFPESRIAQLGRRDLWRRESCNPGAPGRASGRFCFRICIVCSPTNVLFGHGGSSVDSICSVRRVCTFCISRSCVTPHSDLRNLQCLSHKTPCLASEFSIKMPQPIVVLG